MDQMPKEIAGAIVLVMRAIGRLVRDAKNQHGGYSYASTDAFLEAINPACAEAGLIVKPRCVVSEVVTVEVYDKTTKQTIQKRMVQATYAFILIHESGATWCDDSEKRTIMLDHTGPQSFGAAESYAVKTFMRSLFLVATGDKDADAQEQHHAEVIRATVKAVKAKKESGEGQILIDFGNGMEPISASDVQGRVLAYMATIHDAKACADWWVDQKYGREQFHNEFPKLALELKRKVESYIADMGQQAAE